jgi:hypothetical protein
MPRRHTASGFPMGRFTACPFYTPIDATSGPSCNRQTSRAQRLEYHAVFCPAGTDYFGLRLAQHTRSWREPGRMARQSHGSSRTHGEILARFTVFRRVARSAGRIGRVMAPSWACSRRRAEVLSGSRQGWCDHRRRTSNAGFISMVASGPERSGQVKRLWCTTSQRGPQGKTFSWPWTRRVVERACCIERRLGIPRNHRALVPW